MSYSGKTYPIIEILIRLSHFNPAIGQYIGHVIIEHEVSILTTSGRILVPLELLVLQEHNPGEINETTLRLVALSH